MTRRLVVAALSAALLAAPCFGGKAMAQIFNEEAVGRLTVGGGIGVLMPTMGDVNDNLGVVNGFLQRHQLRSLDDVNKGLLTQFEVRYRLGQTPPEEIGTEISFVDRLSVGFAWGAINAQSQFTVEQATLRFYTRATTFYPHLLYHFPFTEVMIPRLQVYAGGGPMLLRGGDVEWVVEDHTSNTPNFLVEGDLSEVAGRGEASGSGLGFALQIGSSFQLNKTFSVALDVGYRRAKLGNLKLGEGTGEASRFPAGGDVVIRDPGVWAVGDFFERDGKGEYSGSHRSDPKLADEQDETGGGCASCREPYYHGDPLEVDFSGPFSTLTLRAHLF